jgi:hypothetical protein
MPTFENIDVETKIDVEFEVYCNTCGKGLYNECDTTRGRVRGYLQVRVNVCPACMQHKDDEIEELMSTITAFEDKIFQTEDK